MINLTHFIRINMDLINNYQLEITVIILNNMIDHNLIQRIFIVPHLIYLKINKTRFHYNFYSQDQVKNLWI